jgi:hypothetical protein
MRVGTRLISQLLIPTEIDASGLILRGRFHIRPMVNGLQIIQKIGGCYTPNQSGLIVISH